MPEDIESADELYLTGLHLEQYRHVTRCPLLYWREALRRDPVDARSNNAIGLWHLRRGEFSQAESHFRAAIERLTRRNANPYDGEPLYNLGLTLCHLDRHDEAYAAFYKATWNQPWQAAGLSRACGNRLSARRLAVGTRASRSLPAREHGKSRHAESESARAAPARPSSRSRKPIIRNAQPRSARLVGQASRRRGDGLPDCKFASISRSIIPAPDFTKQRFDLLRADQSRSGRSAAGRLLSRLAARKAGQSPCCPGSRCASPKTPLPITAFQPGWKKSRFSKPRCG